jgi:YD repeat-containing protein
MNPKIHQRHIRATKLKWPFIAGTLTLSTLLSPVRAELDLPVGVLSNVQETGAARIIVILKMPEQSDGLTTRKGNLYQNINQLQWQFLRYVYPTKEADISGTLDIPEVHQFRTIPAVAMEVDFDTLSKIQENSLVERIEEDKLSSATLSDSTYIIGAVDADGVWQLDYSGAGQSVAVLDTGVDKTHPDLVGRVVSEACYSTTSSSLDATTLCPNGDEEQVGDGAGVVACSDTSGCSHGTHVAGIVAANGLVQGVAKDTDIIAIQVFTRFNSSQYCGSSTPCVLSYTSDQIAGLERVLELHESGMDNIASVNMSLGGGNYSDVCNGAAMEGIIDNLRAADIATIVASGNGGHTDGIASPACISSAISVGATTKADTVARYSNSSDILDLLAPGSFIQSALPGGSTGTKSGTSMAAPHVAGAFAVLKSAAPDASVDEILKVLKRTGKKIEDTRSGIPNSPRITPRINLKKAIKRLVPSVPIPATPDISVTPSSHDFGDVKINESSSVTVTISNTGDSDLDIGQLALTGGDFIISSDNCSNTTVAADNNCTVTVTFNPQSEGAKNATLSIASNDSDTSIATVALIGNGIADVVTPTPAPASPCRLYAVHDQGLNDSQLFTISLDEHKVNPLGSMYPDYDIEALAIHPETKMIYAASSDDATNGKKGYLYTVDGKTGKLISVGSTGFNEIEGLAFSDDGDVLWAWAKGDGLVTINITTGEGEMEIPSNAPVEGLALREDNGTTLFYGTVNTGLDLWKYNPNTGHLNICTNLPGETEALEMMPNGLLLFGTHNDSSFSLHVFDPESCEVIADEDIPTGIFNDVEGIALSTGECAK